MPDLLFVAPMPTVSIRQAGHPQIGSEEAIERECYAGLRWQVNEGRASNVARCIFAYCRLGRFKWPQNARTLSELLRKASVFGLMRCDSSRTYGASHSSAYISDELVSRNIRSSSSGLRAKVVGSRSLSVVTFCGLWSLMPILKTPLSVPPLMK